MTSRVLFWLWCFLLALGISGCASLTVLGPAAGLGIAGIHYLMNGRVERTFSSPLPEVQAAARQALRQMEIPLIKEKGDLRNAELKGAVPDLAITVMLSPITPQATRVSVKAGHGLSRDRATAEAVMNQMALNLASLQTPDLRLGTSDANGRNGRASHGIPSVRWVDPVVPVHQISDGRLETSGVRLQTPDAGPQTPDLYRQAVEAYGKGEFEKAVEGFQRYTRLCPGADRCPSAYFFLGESYALQKDYFQAILAFEMVIREYPSSEEVPRALYREVLIYRTIRQPRLARGALKKLLTRFPQSREARLLRPRTEGG